jgi:hypothetical protein
MVHFVLSFLVFISLTSLVRGQWTPANSPTMQVTRYDNGKASGYMFLGLIGSVSPPPARPTNLILDGQGHIVWFQQNAFSSYDFKTHPNGLMSFFYQGQWLLMDSSFTVSDTVLCEGYPTDVHDLIFRDNGNICLICLNDTIMDLSGMYTRDGIPGDSAGTVRYHLIQELDPDRNVVREWHAIDHFDLSDHDTTFFLQPDRLQLNHTNSIFLDQWDNMILSHRYNHELTYLDWDSGEIIWRLGGANNEFHFVNDIGLNSQHFAQVLPDGKVSVYDNGNYHAPRRARGIVYELDTAAMTATKVWEYANTDIISSAYGSFQVLPNGDRLVNYGAYSPHVDPNVSYLRADSSLVMTIKFEDLYWTYRAQSLEIPFEIERPRIVCTDQNGVLILSANSSYSDYLWTTDATTASITVTDTGDYQLFVPLGLGMVGSEVLHIDDVNAPCSAVSSVEAQPAIVRPPKLLRVVDLLGRTVTNRRSGELYIEVYEDGSSRKVIWR